MDLAVNLRGAAFPMGGQQRVAVEVLKRLKKVTPLAPRAPLQGFKGHLWEQTVLPVMAQGKFLWSPSATGPLVKRDQILTLHDVAFLDVPDYFTKNFVRLYTALLPRLVRRVAKVVTVSEFSRQRIAATLGLDAADIAVIPNGVSEAFRPQSEGEISATRAALDLPPRYLLLQATSDKRKNLARVLGVWQRLADDVDDDVWLVVSGNLSRQHIFGEIGEIEDLRRTKLLGFVAETHLAPLVAGAEAFLFPSLYEGFGLPIVEAMACGTPVLTADATATREVAAGAGLLVDPMSAASLAAGIKAISADRDLRRRLSAAGCARARLYSWDTAAEKYRRLFATFGVSV
jgi:glycosyltransferase involved in cell wall biosynthesis